MAGKEITRIDDIVQLGREYEKLLEWDAEDSTPRPAERIVVKSAAYKPKKGEIIAATIEKETLDELKIKSKGKKKKPEKKEEETPVAASAE